LRAEHQREEFMGQGQVVPIRTVMCHQKPAGQAVLDLAASVCHGGVRRLDNKGMREQKERAMQGHALPDRANENTGLYASPLSPELHIGFEWGPPWLFPCKGKSTGGLLAACAQRICRR